MTTQDSILIVDDNINLSQTMSFVLQDKGYKVLTAGNGASAIRAVKENFFDIIFMDIKMPDMNGVESYKHIKKINPDATVVMMTAYSVESLIQEALMEGAHSVIRKPLDLNKVLAMIPLINKAKRGTFILIVDDDEGISATLKSIFSNEGYKVVTCFTGEQAIQLVNSMIFDIILIDIKLPSINGLETFLAIKEVNPEAVFIMMTGYRNEVSHLVMEALDNNAYTCLYKPLEIEPLLELVNQLSISQTGNAA
ncbi:response regulator [Candidatus Leptofilum sp.]|uniref:response regulator n=1 Tax=Candidatus Leptofilum sp. TaxID=3241576 RepID=UPI003B5C925C